MLFATVLLVQQLLLLENTPGIVHNLCRYVAIRLLSDEFF